MRNYLALLIGLTSSLTLVAHATAELRVGAAVTDVTPLDFPVFVNGGMTSRSVSDVSTRINARSIVIDDGSERLAIVVVDSCMIPRPLCDEAKQLASQRTKIKPDRILISATHTHTAPSCMGALGTDADLKYVPYLREKLAQAVAAAEKNLEPARVGFGKANAADYTALRRWIRRPDRRALDPFGNPTVRANMHAGNNWDDVTGPSGPEDPDLTMISFQAKGGRPIAVLANFSMHYFSGERGLSADYFGRFSDGLKERLAGENSKDSPPFVGIMSHGCSGDIWRRNYALPPEERADFKIDSYTKGLLDIATSAYEQIEYDSSADIAMHESRMTLKYRVPDQQRLEWAQRIVEETRDRLPKTREEVYAREQVILHQRQTTEIVVQGLRIGDIGIATTPNETYALTGLKVKLQSPLRNTMVIELANGGDGYIPPPEQHHLGGYNTWAARSAGLEVEAESKITEAAIQALEAAAGKPRRKYMQAGGSHSKAIMALEPSAYWRLNDYDGSRATDSSEHARDATLEPGVVHFLEGPSQGLDDGDQLNRALHFAGGRLVSRIPKLGNEYTISLWFWNGMPADGRDIAGWLYSRDHEDGISPQGEHLGLGGQKHGAAKLVYQVGEGANKSAVAVGKTMIERWTWNHLALVRNGDNVSVYLNGSTVPELTAQVPKGQATATDKLFFGGRSDNDSNWEGRLDEIAVVNRALSSKEIQGLTTK